VCAGIVVGFPVVVGHRSWMRTLGVVGVMAWTRVGLAKTLGGGEVSELLGWRGDGRLVG
jgi:hypothetical protein